MAPFSARSNDKDEHESFGHVERFGSLFEFSHHPDNLFVAGFIGSPKMDSLQGEMASVSDTTVTVALPSGEQLVTMDICPGL